MYSTLGFPESGAFTESNTESFREAMGEAIVVERVYQCDRDHVASEATDERQSHHLGDAYFFNSDFSRIKLYSCKKINRLHSFANERPCNHSTMSILAQLNDYLTRGLMVSSGKSMPMAHHK